MSYDRISKAEEDIALNDYMLYINGEEIPLVKSLFMTDKDFNNYRIEFDDDNKTVKLYST